MLNVLTNDSIKFITKADNYTVQLNENKPIKSLIVDISPISYDERDRLLIDVSSLDHIESIYLLGKSLESTEQRNELFARFYKVCMLCEDEERLAIRWTLDMADECRTLGNRYTQMGEIETARKHFERGKSLVKRLAYSTK